jgi:hypothetical protein
LAWIDEPKSTQGKENRLRRDCEGFVTMGSATRKTVKFYGAWATLWVAVAFFGNTFSGHGEYGLTAQFVLSLTGLPLALLSWQVAFEGSVAATLSAAVIGLLQWMLVAETNARWESWRRSRHG